LSAPLQPSSQKNYCWVEENIGGAYALRTPPSASVNRATTHFADGVIGISHCYNPSGRTMALGSTQPVNKNECQEYFLAGKGGRCVWLTTVPPSIRDRHEIWEPQPSGTLRSCPGIALPFTKDFSCKFNNRYRERERGGREGGREGDRSCTALASNSWGCVLTKHCHLNVHTSPTNSAV